MFVILRFTGIGREFTEEFSSEFTWLDQSTGGRGSAANRHVTALAFSIDADVEADPYYNFLACGMSDGGIHVYDASNFSLVESFKRVTPGNRPVRELVIDSHWKYIEARDDFSYGGEYIIWTSDAGSGVITWNPRQTVGQRILRQTTVGDDGANELQLDPFYDSDLDQLWVFNIPDQALRCWDCSNGSEVTAETWSAGTMPISWIRRSTNGRYAAIEWEGCYVSVCDGWEASGGMLDFGYPVYSYSENYYPTPKAYAISSLGYLAVTGGGTGDTKVIIHDLIDDQPLWSVDTDYEPSALAFGYHGDRLAIGGQSTVEFWDMYTGQLANQLQLP